MRLASIGEIELRQVPNHLAGGELAEPVVRHVHRRTAVVTIEDGGRRRVIVLDGEDSVFQTSPLIEHCDQYFVCAFNPTFYAGGQLDLQLPWQTDDEVGYYRDRWVALQERYRAHLHKGRRFVPIGPGLYMPPSHDRSRLEQRARNLVHKVRLLATRTSDWREEHLQFEKRYERLVALRGLEPKYDVVLKDSLWGWPRRRIALHRKLVELSRSHVIHSELVYRESKPYELGEHPRPLPSDFPIVAGGRIGDYERMLAESRLAVFATGFHWGCRNIMTLAWFLGLRVFSDPLRFECYCPLDPLESAWCHELGWEQLPAMLESARLERREDRERRWRYFDQVLSPEVTARYLLESALG